MFFALLRAGLWERGVRLSKYETPGPSTAAFGAQSLVAGVLDTEAVYKIADEQAVVGIVAAGFEHVEDRKMQKAEVLSFLKKAVSIEGRNMTMNDFVASLLGKMQAEGISALLVKGQGIAQCYERPLWRSSGDVDLLLDAANYEKAKAFLPPLATSVEREDTSKKHLGMHFDKWVLELHGTLHNTFSKRSNAIFDSIWDEMFRSENFRLWNNNGTVIYLPAPDCDVLVVFSHIIQHFFAAGIGLRQICDWCRLLWTFRSQLDLPLLERRLSELGLITEWKAFAAYAVDYLGMPVEAMPFYDPARRWSRKAHRINRFILYMGNFGHNRDRSYYLKYNFLLRKSISLWYIFCDFFVYLPIFPKDALRILWHRLVYGFSAAAQGE